MKIGDCEQGKNCQLRRIAYAFFEYVLRGVWKLLRFSSERKQHAARTVTAVQFGDLSGVQEAPSGQNHERTRYKVQVVVDRIAVHSFGREMGGAGQAFGGTPVAAHGTARLPLGETKNGLGI